MPKSRVAPIKHVSIPKLELMVAVLATKLSQVMMREMDVSSNPSIKELFWTDSQVVLGYI